MRTTDRRNLYTVREFAELSGVKPDTLRHWIHCGSLKATNLSAGTGRRPRWRIHARELARIKGS